jgi:hypothetical protein
MLAAPFMQRAGLLFYVCWCVQYVAFMVREGVTAEQCKHRFWHLQHVVRQTGTFTAQESRDAMDAVREHGKDWIKVRSLHYYLCYPASAGLQCRRG